MSKITIQGIDFEGENINIVGKKIFIDGKEKNVPVDGRLDIHVTGIIQSLTVDGNVTAQTVKGNVQAGGNVCCEAVGGSVVSDGNVKCGRIGGDVKAGGNIRHA